MLGWAFLAASPRPYMRMPQATEQYGQVLRVSVARESLYSRTSASAGPGAKPITARLEPTSDRPVTFKNWRLVNSGMTFSLRRPTGNPKPANRKRQASKFKPAARARQGVVSPGY